MNKEILLLLSDLRGIDRLIASFQTYFPDFHVVPLIFADGREILNCPPDCILVSRPMFNQFVSDFDFSGVHALFVSFMTTEKLLFIKRAPLNIKLIWSIPGGDLYNRYLRYFGYHLLYEENKNLKYIVGKIIRWLPRRLEFDYLLKRCSAIASAKCDYALIEKFSTNGANLPAHIYAIAYPMPNMLGSLYGLPFAEHDEAKVIVGNSASRTNNHLYLLRFLRSINIDKLHFSLLLSYGDSDKRYINRVVTAYKKSLGDNVSFVTDYVPLREFNNRLLTATHFVYGNWRQEAVGNILTAFYLGGKVYLSRYNPLLDDFRQKGFIVFCLEDIDESFITHLTKEEKVHNRTLIDTLYSEERAEMLFKNGFSSLLIG